MTVVVMTLPHSASAGRWGRGMEKGTSEEVPHGRQWMITMTMNRISLFGQGVFPACNTGMGHFIGREDAGHGFFGDQLLLQNDFTHRFAGGVGFSGSGSAFFVADMGQQGCDDAAFH